MYRAGVRENHSKEILSWDVHLIRTEELGDGLLKGGREYPGIMFVHSLWDGPFVGNSEVRVARF